MAEYKKRNVKKLKTKKPNKRSAIADTYRVTSFDANSIPDEIAVKTAKQAKAERKFEKQKTKYLKREQPQKRVVYTDKSAADLNKISSSFKLITGTKNANKIKRITTFLISTLIILTIVVLQIITPTGIIDSVKDAFAKTGSGAGFPININGEKVIDIFDLNGGIAVLSNKNIEIYNTASRELVSEEHGFSNPRCAVSENRIIIYDQGSYGILVYDLNGKVLERTMKESIITANIGRKGSFLVVTDSSSAASALYAYDKNNSKIFKWSSKSDIISSVAISKNGKYFAALAINAKNGVYQSTLNVFDKGGKKPVSTCEEEQLILNVSEMDNSGFVLTATDQAYYYNVKDGNKTYFAENDNIIYKSSGERFGYMHTVVSDTSDASDKVNIYLTHKKKFSGVDIITSPKRIDWTKEYIVCSKDYSLYIYNMEGKQIISKNFGINTDKFVVIGNKVYILNNSTIIEYKISSNTE